MPKDRKVREETRPPFSFAGCQPQVAVTGRGNATGVHASVKTGSGNRTKSITLAGSSQAGQNHAVMERGSGNRTDSTTPAMARLTNSGVTGGPAA